MKAFHHRGRILLTLKLRLAKGRGVGGDEDQLGLAGAQGFLGASVAEGDFA